jgi:hypothetical protein
MRLKVRQWTQMLVDHSLLLGSFTKGVHVHDIVLTYLRNTHSPSELRALQKRVVEELVRVSTSRAFEDTGSTAKAFAGEEVDWYVCNVGSFHIQQSMDRSVPVTENEDVARYLMLEDTVLFQQTALAVGEEELRVLAAHFIDRSQWVEAAKAKYAVYLVSSSQTVAMMDEVVELLEKCGPMRTIGALQLELDLTSSSKYMFKYTSGSAERAQLGARVAELSQNPSLRTNPWSLAVGNIYPKVVFLCGVIPMAWESGKRVDGDSVLKGMSLWYNQATPLMQSACDSAVGARKEWFTISKLACTPMISPGATAYVSNDTVALFQAATDEQWGADCSKMMEAISIYKFDRHFQIARSTTSRNDTLLSFAVEVFIAEKTGNIQQCIEINDRKYRSIESYMRAAPSAYFEIPLFLYTRGVFIGTETHLQHLQPHHNLSGVLKYAGFRSTQQAEEGYRSSAEYASVRAITTSSVDGLHHLYPEHAQVALIRALMSLSVDNMDLSWLDSLPPADAPPMYDLASSAMIPVTARVLVAEVFEQQGRHADAIRFAQTDLQDYHNLNAVSKVRAGRVLGRNHAALGQHMLSVSAFDAAIDLAQSKKLLLSEALAVRGRAAPCRNGAGSSELLWDEITGKERLVEMVSRMQGPRDVLERVLMLPPQ